MVHTFSALGRNLAVDVNSGAVHVLDKLCCDLLSLVEGPMGDACPQDLKDRLSQYDARELDEAWTELLELQAGPAEETSFRMPEGELETEPFPVPESPVPLLDAPQGLTAQESPGPAFDPANLQG